jgi:hypothetical protein
VTHGDPGVDDGTEPIADDELLYRRIPTSVPWYSASAGLSSQAFAPHTKNDITGLSVSRAKYKSIQAAAKGRPGKSYYVAILRAGDLRQRGIQVVPHPLPEDPGHAELPDLNAGNRETDETLERERVLAQELCLQVEGPFGSP